MEGFLVRGGERISGALSVDAAKNAVLPIDLHLSGLRRMGVVIEEAGGALQCDGRQMHAADIHLDYPSVGATENVMMAAVLTLASVARGSSVIVENVFENRFALAGDLNRMGANIRVAGRAALIQGVDKLIGASVCARDLRSGVELIDRGYVRMEERLQALGARIRRVRVND